MLEDQSLVTDVMGRDAQNLGSRYVLDRLRAKSVVANNFIDHLTSVGAL